MRRNWNGDVTKRTLDVSGNSKRKDDANELVESESRQRNKVRANLCRRMYACKKEVESISQKRK